MRELKLVRPTGSYEEQVMSYREEMLKNGDSFDGCAGLEKVSSYSEWLDFEGRLKAKYGEGYVPSEVFLAVRKKYNAVVGIIVPASAVRFSASVWREYWLQYPPVRKKERICDGNAWAAFANLPGVRGKKSFAGL